MKNSIIEVVAMLVSFNKIERLHKINLVLIVYNKKNTITKIKKKNEDIKRRKNSISF